MSSSNNLDKAFDYLNLRIGEIEFIYLNLVQVKLYKSSTILVMEFIKLTKNKILKFYKLSMIPISIKMELISETSPPNNS